jgi:aspartyl-tRNA(Asn)/glutamyl-tRNA(Gln) amidotransferase subunit B
VSVRKPGQPLGTRREIKNLNSFRFMQQAIDFEIRWQIEELEDGRAIQQATVLFNPDTGETRAMRSKEDAADYRYFPDPDLPPLVIAPEWIDRVRSGMTELPRVMAARFVADHGLSEYDATTLTQSKAMAAYFEATARACGQPKLASNWIMGEVSRRLNAEEGSFDKVRVHPLELAALLTRIAEGAISNNAARQVFDELWSSVEWNAAGGRNIDSTLNESVNVTDRVDAIIETKGLKQMNDTGALEKIVDTVLAANPKNVAEYRAGNSKALNALVGQIMKASQGKANPQQVNDLLRQKLA